MQLSRDVYALFRGLLYFFAPSQSCFVFLTWNTWGQKLATFGQKLEATNNKEHAILLSSMQLSPSQYQGVKCDLNIQCKPQVEAPCTASLSKGKQHKWSKVLQSQPLQRQATQMKQKCFKANQRLLQPSKANQRHLLQPASQWQATPIVNTEQSASNAN